MKNEIISRAKKLRENRTEAETHLWHFIRARRLGGYKFRRQHPLGNFIVDFYCPEKKLAVELDGEHHENEEQLAYDQKRACLLGHKGIKVLRYWNHDVFLNTEGVMEDLLRELEER